MKSSKNIWYFAGFAVIIVAVIGLVVLAIEKGSSLGNKAGPGTISIKLEEGGGSQYQWE